MRNLNRTYKLNTLRKTHKEHSLLSLNITNVSQQSMNTVDLVQLVIVPHGPTMNLANCCSGHIQQHLQRICFTSLLRNAVARPLKAMKRNSPMVPDQQYLKTTTGFVQLNSLALTASSVTRPWMPPISLSSIKSKVLSQIAASLWLISSASCELSLRRWALIKSGSNRHTTHILRYNDLQNRSSTHFEPMTFHSLPLKFLHSIPCSTSGLKLATVACSDQKCLNQWDFRRTSVFMVGV